VTDVVFRRATRADIPGIVAMLTDDPIGVTREDPADMTPYFAAFERIDADAAQHLLVAERDGQLLATMQVTMVPGLGRRGATRAMIEAVRVASGARGEGLGTRLIEYAIDMARAQGAALVQLTSDATRTDAHRFYERLGFDRTHYGFKLMLLYSSARRPD
jgi:GNAT superfamily N-acetyltransferase